MSFRSPAANLQFPSPSVAPTPTASLDPPPRLSVPLPEREMATTSPELGSIAVAPYKPPIQIHHLH